jgi:hypothetical protein
VPDIFSHVSSYTRDSPYIDVPHGGSGLDGSERAKLLRKNMVQLGDVDPSSGTGYIALQSVSADGDLESRKVRRNRMYY